MTESLDKTDIAILRILQENARITVKDLALKVHLSPTPSSGCADWRPAAISSAIRPS